MAEGGGGSLIDDDVGDDDPLHSLRNRVTTGHSPPASPTNQPVISQERMVKQYLFPLGKQESFGLTHSSPRDDNIAISFSFAIEFRVCLRMVHQCPLLSILPFHCVLSPDLEAPW